MKQPHMLMLAASAAGLASCNAGPAYQGPSPRAQAELAKALEGRVAGPPQQCISNYQSTSMSVIDDHTILFGDGRTVWVQKPRGGCTGLAIGGNTLVTRPFGTSQLCVGDINHLVNLQTGMDGGACVFGPFVPYTKPR